MKTGTLFNLLLSGIIIGEGLIIVIDDLLFGLFFIISGFISALIWFEAALKKN